MNPYPLHKVSYFNLASMSTLEMTSVEIGPYTSSFVCAWYRISGFLFGVVGSFLFFDFIGGCVCDCVCMCEWCLFWVVVVCRFFPLVFVCVRFWVPLFIV